MVLVLGGVHVGCTQEVSVPGGVLAVRCHGGVLPWGASTGEALTGGQCLCSSSYFVIVCLFPIVVLRTNRNT